ncbi:hypothetical protein IMZ48_20560, partial [Candidatus Bathyarchaeota archaeon]|nr:hypothetical protein [Candidatus Bathyarchaeota archaeon]
SYFLQPLCFLVDRGAVEVARSRGINLVSLSRRWQALRGDDGAESLRPGELDMGGASVSMVCDGGYVVVSIHKSDAGDAPVFIETEDEEQGAMEVDGDAADGKPEP